MTSAADLPARVTTRLAPTNLPGILKQLGPGRTISAVIVGSGERIVTPKLGAAVGFQLLWISVVSMAIAGGYKTLEELSKLIP